MSLERKDGATKVAALVEWCLIVSGLLVAVATLSPSVGGDGAVRFETVARMLNSGGGFSKFSLIQPLLSLPLAWLALAFEARPVVYVAYFNFLIFSVLSVPCYLELARRYSPGVGRKWLLLMLGASMFPHHWQNYYGEVLSALCLFAGALWVERRPLPAALLLAIGCINTPALLLPMIALAVTWFVMRKKVAPSIAVVLALVVIVAEMWFKGILDGQGYFSDSEHGFQTVLPYSGLPGFSYPVSLGVLSIVLSFGKGLVFYIPALMLLASRRVRSHLLLEKGATAIVLVALLSPILLYAKWWAWYGGSFWGPRFFLFLCPPACLIMAVCLQQRWPPARLAFLAVIVSLSGWVAVNGFTFGQAQMDACWAENYAREYLCWYVPEFSALWRPFVTGQLWHVLSDPRGAYAMWDVVAVCYLIWVAIRNSRGLRVHRGHRLAAAASIRRKGDSTPS
ncbi:hypothetical protein [Xanthomonas bonasiae]|uniref:hypothetical protein n=1 Tax=Xanthomonas bonasiae TaxID=2810351 RepID=UPI00197E0406|nr:hypothetical protein [Xanthomonas bonasiae]MBN6109999.1 hypothetical protein [Xanthomonas bonasiae]